MPHPFTSVILTCECGVRYDSEGWIYLSAFKVTLEGGRSYVTNMAKGVTLEEARAYFMGQALEQPDGSTRRVVAVEVDHD